MLTKKAGSTDLPALLAEAERVMDGVTPGPLAVRHVPHGNHVTGPHGVDVAWVTQGMAAGREGSYAITHDEARANAAFIAAARTLLPAIVAALRTPPSEEEWRGVMREHADVELPTGQHGSRWQKCNPTSAEQQAVMWTFHGKLIPCLCGATEHNARVTALRAAVEVERERTRRVVEAAVAYVTSEGYAGTAKRFEAHTALVEAVRALRGEP